MSPLFFEKAYYIKKEHYSNFCTFATASLPNVPGLYLRKYGTLEIYHYGHCYDIESEKNKSYSLDRGINFAINENSRSQKLFGSHCVLKSIKEKERKKKTFLGFH